MMNSIYFGDNLPILRKLPSESVDLIYIDPPFNTRKTQRRTTLKTVQDVRGDRKGFNGKTYRTTELGTTSYEDSHDSYIDGFLEPRLREAYRILKPHGSLYFHIDYREVHYCKLLLDRIFGRECFLNEIIWAYDYGGKARSKWPAKHDNILFYVKDPKNYIFNRDAINREPYMAPGLVGPEKARRGKMPTDTWWPAYSGTDEPKSPLNTWWRHYAIGNDQIDVWLVSKDVPTGQNAAWWETIVPTGSHERLGYPTQKPRKLIDRIIRASSLEGSVVLDFFAGSGTVGESCLELGRGFVLIDNNRAALEAMARRFSSSAKIDWINFDPKPYRGRARNQSPRPGPSEAATYNKEFVMLAGMASYLQLDLEGPKDLWENSPFEWILKLPPRKKGKLGGQLVAAWLINKGLRLDSTKDVGESLVIGNLRFAIKFSTLWEKGVYKFQQIRPTGYDYVICLGISPFDAHCWVFERAYAVDHARPQHRGTKIADYWMEINPAEPPDWAAEHGGTMNEALKIVRKLTKN